MGAGCWMSLFSKRGREGGGRQGDGDDASNGRFVMALRRLCTICVVRG